MRILHTSDWHLGQNFYSKKPRGRTRRLSRLAAGARAGTRGGCHYRRWRYFFDTGSPPSYARELYNRFCRSAAANRLPVGGAGGQPRFGGDVKRVARNTRLPENHRGRQRRPRALYLAAARRRARRGLLPGAVFLRPRELVVSRAGHSSGEKNSSSCSPPSATTISSNISRPAICAANGHYRLLPAATSPPSVPAKATRSVKSISAPSTPSRPIAFRPPITSRSAIFIAPSWLAAASIFATAVRRCR